MISKQLIFYLDTKKWEWKRTVNDEIIINECPFCHDVRGKFYIHENTGLWHCKICDESGNFYQLKARLGDLNEISSINSLIKNKYKPLDEKIINEYITNLKNDNKAYNYLLKRGFTDDTIKHFKLGVEDEWITIPHFQNKKLWNIKKRNYIEKEFKRVAGQPSILFNVDNVNLNKKSLVIVESETDCMAAYQMRIHNVVALTTGATSFLPEWVQWVQQFKNIYICLNSDMAGQRGAYKIAEKIGFKKCRNLILPTNDINDYLLEKSSKEFLHEFKNVKEFSIKNITRISEYVEQLDEWFSTEGSLKGLELPFDKINNYVKGFKHEDLIILTGDAGIGKTTFSLNILLSFLKKNHKCLGFFLEGKIMYYILRMMSIETKTKVEELNDFPEDWKNIKKKFLDYQMFFYSGPQLVLNPHNLAELLSVAVKTYDIEYVIIDNLQKFVKDDRNVVQQISQAVSVLKDLAVDLKIPILLISHIRKLEGNRKRISMHDAKSSSTIYQDADMFFILWNNKKQNAEDDDLIFSIAKNRMGEGGQDISIIFEKQIALFRERIDEIDGKKTKLKIIDMTKID